MAKDDGFTPLERRVSDALCDAVNAFSLLERQHPDEARDFRDAIHRVQDLMAMRIVRRDHPEGWPTYREIEGEWEPIEGDEPSGEAPR